MSMKLGHKGIGTWEGGNEDEGAIVIYRTTQPVRLLPCRRKNLCACTPGLPTQQYVLLMLKENVAVGLLCLFTGGVRYHDPFGLAGCWVSVVMRTGGGYQARCQFLLVASEHGGLADTAIGLPDMDGQSGVRAQVLCTATFPVCASVFSCQTECRKVQLEYCITVPYLTPLGFSIHAIPKLLASEHGYHSDPAKIRH